MDAVEEKAARIFGALPLYNSQRPNPIPAPLSAERPDTLLRRQALSAMESPAPNPSEGPQPKGRAPP